MVKICSLLCIDVYGCKKPCKHDFTTNDSFEPGFFMQNFYPSELVSCGFSCMQISLHCFCFPKKMSWKKLMVITTHFKKGEEQKKNNNTHKIYTCIYVFICTRWFKVTFWSPSWRSPTHFFHRVTFFMWRFCWRPRIVPHMKQIVNKEVRLARQRQQAQGFLGVKARSQKKLGGGFK